MKLGPRPSSFANLPEPIRDELWSVERLEQHALAHDFGAHTDSLFDAEVLRRFIVAYQTVQPLTIGELWAVAISLRLVLVENLRRLAERMVRARVARQQADELADRLLDEDEPV